METNSSISRTPPANVRWVRTLATLLDSGLKIPGTEIRFGLDPLIGLVPGVGDAIGALLGSLILFHAARSGAPKRHLALMLGNLFLDYFIGLVPILGDILDVSFRANERNLKIIEDIPASSWGPRRDASAVGRIFVFGLLLCFALVIGALTVVAVFAIRSVA